MVTSWPTGAQGAHHALEDRSDPRAAVGIAAAQDGGDELVRFPVEDEQGMVHVLPVEPW